MTGPRTTGGNDVGQWAVSSLIGGSVGWAQHSLLKALTDGPMILSLGISTRIQYKCMYRHVHNWTVIVKDW